MTFARPERVAKPEGKTALPSKLKLWTSQEERRKQRQFAREYRLVAESGLFDRAFYFEQNPDVLAAGADPLLHYWTFGAFEGRNPNPLFDSRWYWREHPDVAAAGVNPLLHYVRSGESEGRDPHPLFDVSRYLELYADVRRDGGSPLLHFLGAGGAEGRNPHPLFDSPRYRSSYSHSVPEGANPLLHYLTDGWRKGFNPHALFDGNYYLRKNPDLRRAGVNPLVHFVTQGFKECRPPNPLFDCRYYMRLFPEAHRQSVNPLSHYILHGAHELRNPHPLFDAHYFHARNPRLLFTGKNPLAHYFEHGAASRTSPHPLFNVHFYLEQEPAIESGDTDLLVHYLEEGAEAGLDPCELFDSSYYLAQYSEVKESGQNPLVHYIVEGGRAGYNPNPVFDTAHYLRQHHDVSSSDQNALVHYVESGAFEGRSPSPFFDSAFYLRKNPGLSHGRGNPLAHYLSKGTQQNQDPSPFFSTADYLKDHPELAGSGVNALVHFLASRPSPVSEPMEKTAPAEPARISIKLRKLEPRTAQRVFDDRSDLVICISHVSPHPPRAGNEYRIHQMLQWMRSQQYRILPVISPLAGEAITDAQILDLAEEFGAAILCERDGSVTYCLSEADAKVLAPEEGVTPPSFSAELGENRPMTVRDLQLLTIDRTFCHDALIHIVRKLAAERQRCAILAEYIFMSRVLPLLDERFLKMIDTHDVFSSKSDKVVAFGVSDSLSFTPDEEATRLSRAQLILAIQPEEQASLQALTEGGKVITAGVDFPVLPRRSLPAKKSVLYVASNNGMNAHGLNHFLRFAWPSVVRSVPTAELIIAGKVCESVRVASKNVTLLGPVEDLNDLYMSARLTVNPALAGTGLKIKTLESLSHLRPIVTWPTGIDGLHPDLASKCCVISDWFEFSSRIIQILSDQREHWFTEYEARLITDLLSPGTVYAQLGRELHSYFRAAKAATA